MVHQAEKVKITEVGSRGVAFSFYEDFLGDTTFSYLINAEKRVYLFDTFCGPDSMEHIKDYLREKKINEKPLVIVITHNHWDHFWGNCAFPEHLIISHTLCRQGMQETAQADLERMKKWQQGEVEIVLPNLVFKNKIAFPEEGIDIFHAPGHTPDQISAYDTVDKVLIVGDNLESPIPYITETNISPYIETLNQYKATDWNHLILGHGEIQRSPELLHSNLDYIQNFMDLTTPWNDFEERMRKIHIANLTSVCKKFIEEEKPNQAKQMLAEVLKVGASLNGDFYSQKIEETKKMLEKIS